MLFFNPNPHPYKNGRGFFIRIRILKGMVRCGLPDEVTEFTVEVTPKNKMPEALEEPIKDNLTVEQRKRDLDMGEFRNSLTVLYLSWLDFLHPAPI